MSIYPPTDNPALGTYPQDYTPTPSDNALLQGIEDGGGPTGIVLTTTSAVITSNNSLVISANPLRRSLVIINRGVGLVDLAFDVAAVSGSGWPLAPATTTRGCGGEVIWNTSTGITKQAVNAICATGVSTNLTIIEGV